MLNKNTCKLRRRLMAIAYDCCLLGSVLFFATALVLPLTGGAAFPAGDILYSIYLTLICYLYFVWQWSKGQQTLGMRAWRLCLRAPDGALPGWRALSLRFILAGLSWSALGAGFFWAWLDRDRLAFHDRFSKTILIVSDKR